MSEELRSFAMELAAVADTQWPMLDRNPEDALALTEAGMMDLETEFMPFVKAAYAQGVRDSAEKCREGQAAEWDELCDSMEEQKGLESFGASITYAAHCVSEDLAASVLSLLDSGGGE